MSDTVPVTSRRKATWAASFTLVASLSVSAAALHAQVISAAPAAPPVRTPPPTRDPHTAGYPAATDLADGALPPRNAIGNFVIGPTHTPAPEMAVSHSAPHGAVYTFTMRSDDSRIYPGIARDSGTFGTPDPADPAILTG